jgi:hypothetical protein
MDSGVAFCFPPQSKKCGRGFAALRLCIKAVNQWHFFPIVTCHAAALT